MIPIRREWSAMKRLALLSPALAVPLEEATASGNPVVFQTDVSKPLKSLLIPFTPVQSGTGDPSPSNIRSILPWNGLTVWNGGKNLIQDNKNLQPIFMPKGTKLFASIKRGATSSSNPSVTFYTENKTAIDYWTLNNAYMDGRTGRGFTLTDDVYWFSIVADDANALERQLEIGTSGSAYEPYEPITETDISFPSTVYGGTLDVVTGELWQTFGLITLTGNESYHWRVSGKTIYTSDAIFSNIQMETVYINGFCSACPNSNNRLQYVTKNGNGGSGIGFANADTFWGLSEVSGEALVAMLQEMNTAGTPMQVAYPLATPQEITLTPEQITALKGDNTIWSDADGSMTAVYLKKK